MKHFSAILTLIISLHSQAATVQVCSALNACGYPEAADQICVSFDSEGPAQQKVSITLIKHGQIIDSGSGVTSVVPGHTVTQRLTGDTRWIPEHPGLNFETQLFTGALEFFKEPTFSLVGTIQNKATGASQYLMDGPVLCK